MYTKSIVQLLRALRISEQSGTVIIEPVQQLNELPCFAQLCLVKGNINGCQIMSKRGGELLLRDNKALVWLQSIGRLFWQWEGDAPAHTLKSTSRHPTVEQQKVERPVRTRSSVYLEGDLPRNTTVSAQITEAGIPRRGQDEKFAVYLISSSREYRKILALVDGHRSIREIAVLSHTSSQHIIDLLHSLSAKKIVAL